MPDLLGRVIENPVVQGVGGALAFGANPLVGLLAAPGIKAGRERRALENELLRSELKQRNRQSKAREELRGLLGDLTSVQALSRELALEGIEGDDPSAVFTIPGKRGEVPTIQTAEGQQRLLGLLADVSPNVAAQGLLANVLPQTQRSEPTVIRVLRSVGIDPESQKGRDIALSSLVQRGADDATLTRINLALKELELQKTLRDLQGEDTDKTKKRDFLEADITKTLSDALTFLDLNDKLEGTFLQPGQPGTGIRRSLASLGAEVGGAFGADTSGAQENVENLDKFSKLASTFGIKAITRLRDAGAITDAKFSVLQQSIAGIGVNPGANRQITADLIDEFLTLAEIEGIDIPNARELRRRARDAREQRAENPNESDIAKTLEENRVQARGERTEDTKTRDVTLPDGTVVTNVPPNVTRAQLIEMAKSR